MRLKRVLVLPLLAAAAMAVLLASGAEPVKKAPARPAKKLVVAIGRDIPPFIMQKASKGLEVDILRDSLKGYDLKFIQVSYKDLPAAVQKKKADAAAAVLAAKDGSFYSDPFISFHNVAISKKSAKLKIDGVAGLKGQPVLCWQNACMDLGTEFEKMFSTKGTERKHYTEFPDQRLQVQKFWQSKNAVIVIDRDIFAAFSEQLKHSMDDVTIHAIFPPVTHFQVAFKDESVRDEFNKGLARLREDGTLAKLYKQNNVPFEDSADQDVRRAAADFYTALNALFKGDVQPMEQVWSHASDVTYMGPAGGIQVGWQDVLAEWKKQAAMKLGGEVKAERLQVTLGKDLAIIQNQEKGQNTVDGKAMTVSIRATSIFRKEAGKWKMISHHADILPQLKK